MLITIWRQELNCERCEAAQGDSQRGYDINPVRVEKAFAERQDIGVHNYCSLS